MTATAAPGLVGGRRPAPVRPPALPGSTVLPYGRFEFELLAEGASTHPEALTRLSADVLQVAARSRGWTEPAEIARFARAFTLQPLFEADGLALVWRDGRLVGLAGAVHRLDLPGGAIVHLCSVGFLPEAQNRGFLAALFRVLWDVVGRVPRLAEPFRSGNAYLTAITQSPYLVSFLSRVSDLHPAPGRGAPGPRTLEVARRVHACFDPDIRLDPRTLVLREECGFAYRAIPYSTDREVNRFCDARLRYAAGDTFLLVGRVRPEVVAGFSSWLERRDPGLLAALRDGLPAPAGARPTPGTVR
jgi:hypothetical protein